MSGLIAMLAVSAAVAAVLVACLGVAAASARWRRPADRLAGCAAIAGLVLLCAGAVLLLGVAGVPWV